MQKHVFFDARHVSESTEEMPRYWHVGKDGFGSDTDEIGFGYHLLPHFNPDTNTNADLIRYEYKTDSSNSDTIQIPSRFET